MTESTFILVLSGSAILAIVIGIARLVSSNAKAEAHKLTNESKQNRFFELGQELGKISELFNNNRSHEALERFLKISSKIDSFSHSDFNSIEWKSYFSSIKASKDEMAIFVLNYYKQEFEKLKKDNLSAVKAKQELETQVNKRNSLIGIFVTLIVMIGYLIKVFILKI
jgi:glycosylphosphatidylinositol transamidase (GPIT) subunit GPI8